MRVPKAPLRLFAAALIGMVAVSATMAGALPIAQAVGDPKVFVSGAFGTLIVDRPEIRSYQPYSGLQFNFSPEPPIQRGVGQKRPKIVAPRPVEPVIEYGAPRAYSAEGYAYCPDRPGQIEPREGPYAGAPLGQRTCP